MKVRRFVCDAGCAGGKCFIAVDTDTGHGSGDPPKGCAWTNRAEEWKEIQSIILDDPAYFFCKRNCVSPCILVVERDAAELGCPPSKCPWNGMANWKKEEP
jgi:hypothetical protein